MAIQYLDALRTTMTATIGTAIDAGAGAGTLTLYDGTPPADADTAPSGNTTIAVLTFTDPSTLTNTGGVWTADTITADSSADADSVGGVTFFRVHDSNSLVVMQGTVTTTGVGTGDLLLNSVDVTTGDNVAVSSFVITEGNN